MRTIIFLFFATLTAYATGCGQTQQTSQVTTVENQDPAHRTMQTRPSPVFSSTQDCRAIVMNTFASCRSNDCKGIVLNQEYRCESADCTAMVWGQAFRCESDDCRAYVYNNSGLCTSRKCQGIVLDQISFCL